MPSLITRLRAALKAFRLGPAAVDDSAVWYGTDTARFAPESYADYIATSVGVYSATTLRAQNLASLPICLYKGTGEDREEVTSGHLFDLLQKVNPFWTLSHLIEMTESALCLWGSAYWVLNRGKTGRGVPTEIWWARPDRMVVYPDKDKYISHFGYTHQGDEILFDPSEIVWFRYPNPIDEWSGLSPLAAARQSVDLGLAGLKSNAALFKQGMQLGGVIAPHDPAVVWKKDQVEGIAETLQRKFTGGDRAHKWLVLGHAMKVESMGVSPKDAEFIGQMRWSLGDICRVYQVPPILLQDLERSTFENFEQAQRAFWTLCMAPEARRVSGWLREQLLPMFPGEADDIDLETSGVAALQEAEGAREERERQQIADGRITINEWRQDRGLEPVPWGDAWWAPQALSPVEGAKREMPQSLLPAAIDVDAEVLEDEEPDEDAEPAELAQRALQLLRSFRDETAETERLAAAEDASRLLAEREAAERAAVRDEEELSRRVVLEASERRAAELRARMAYGSAEHREDWRAFDERARRHEDALAQVVRRLFERQRDAVLARLRTTALRSFRRAVLGWMLEEGTSATDVLRAVQKQAFALEEIEAAMPEEPVSIAKASHAIVRKWRDSLLAPPPIVLESEPEVEPEPEPIHTAPSEEQPEVKPKSDMAQHRAVKIQEIERDADGRMVAVRTRWIDDAPGVAEPADPDLGAGEECRGELDLCADERGVLEDLQRAGAAAAGDTPGRPDPAG